MDRDMMDMMISDYLADHEDELSDLVVDRETIRYDEDDARWECNAHDDKACYVLVDYDGDIRIFYVGTR